MNEKATEMLNFNKLEDRFFCIDVLTRVKFSIKSSETELVADIDRIIVSLTDISENPPTDNIEIRPQVESKEIINNDTNTIENDTNDTVDDNDDSIIDLLTGEKIS